MIYDIYDYDYTYIYIYVYGPLLVKIGPILLLHDVFFIF